MAKGKNHIDPIKELSLAKMQAYVRGELSSAEQYQVEKYLLDHPFEAEAMEGYLENPAAFEDINTLTDRLGKRTDGEKERAIIPFWRKALPYAAVFLLLIISSVFTINFFQQEESFAPIAIDLDDALEVNTEEKSITPPIAIKPVLEEEKVENQLKEVVQKLNVENKEVPEKVAEENRDKEPPLPKEPISPDVDLAVAEIVDMEEIDLTDNINIALQGKTAGVQIKKMKSQSKTVTGAASVVPAEETPLNDSANLSRSRKSIQSMVAGVVLEAESGEPLPGVNVLIKGTAIGTNTDLEGNFELMAEEGDVLVAAFIGMQKQEFLISDVDDIEIFMNADVAQLSEVVVIGYGTEKKEDVSYTAARPSIGFSDYRDYLKGNLQYPQEAKANDTEGRVRLKLSISGSGNIEDVEVLKSLGDGCDEEAIRLVKEGPRWQAAKKGEENVTSTRKIAVRFKLD